MKLAAGNRRRAARSRRTAMNGALAGRFRRKRRPPIAVASHAPKMPMSQGEDDDEAVAIYERSRLLQLRKRLLRVNVIRIKSLDLRESLLEVLDEVFGILKPNGKADQVWRDARLPKLLVGELTVRVRCRMKHTAPRIGNVRHDAD